MTQNLTYIIIAFTGYHAIALILNLITAKIFLFSGIGLVRLLLKPAKTAKSGIKLAGKTMKHGLWAVIGTIILLNLI